MPATAGVRCYRRTVVTAPRQISTMHKPTPCGVCGRTLLRGERPDVFLHDGERCMVCELCTQRAVADGWIREGADSASTVANGWMRRGTAASTIAARWRRRGRDDQAELLVPQEAEGLMDQGDEPPVYEYEVPPPDMAPPAPSRRTTATSEPLLYREDRFVHAIPTNADMKVVRGIELFNASQHPRTIAGVARSLGAPLVSVRPSPTEGSIVWAFIAWELSWYQFEVDLADEAAGVRMVERGTELDELDPQDRLPNAVADEFGALHAAVAPDQFA